MRPEWRRYGYSGRVAEAMLDDAILHDIDWRPGDIVISGPPKCGTNWMQQMVHQLRSGGDTAFASIRAEVPVFGHAKVGIDRDEELRQFAARPDPRALKTHFGPPVLPIVPGVRYLVVVRDVLEVPISLMAFLNAWSPAMRARTGMPLYRDLEELLDDLDDFAFYFAFLEGWWSHRNAPGVWFFHFHDMKRDPDGTLRSLADFLGFDVSDPERFERIRRYCSFEWMKQHEAQFERNWDGSQMLASGQLIRRGRSGENTGLLPDAIRDRLEAQRRRLLTHPELGRWVREGGSFPR
ncbi:MAG: sulfotransferase domain-containing protein [bacterium]